MITYENREYGDLQTRKQAGRGGEVVNENRIHQRKS